MRLMSSASWERIFTTIRNLFHTFTFYILKSVYLYCSREFFLKINIFLFFSTWFKNSTNLLDMYEQLDIHLTKLLYLTKLLDMCKLGFGYYY